MSPGGPASWARETRLLMLTLAVSIGALVILARFRFPEQQRPEPPPQPLERLAARATYDELASIVARLERRIAPSMVVLRVSGAASSTPKTLDSVLQRRDDAANMPIFAAGLRIRPDVVLVRMLSGLSVEGILGDEQAVPLLIAMDPIRQVALVRVPPPPADAEWAWQPAETIAVPRYVVAVEGSRGGATPRPVFLGRAVRIESLHWGTPLLVLARTPVTAEGSFIFTLDGMLIGMAAGEAGVLAVIPGTTLRAIADDLLEHGSPSITDFGLALRALTSDLAKEVGATSGVVVASVTDKSPSAGKLHPGDLIRAVDGRPAANPEVVLLQLARVPANGAARFTIRRGTEDLTLDVPALASEVTPASRNRP